MKSVATAMIPLTSYPIVNIYDDQLVTSGVDDGNNANNMVGTDQR